MRLTDLDPHWVTFAHVADKTDFRFGVTFLCPHCRDVRLCALFDPPIAPGADLPGMGWPPANMRMWQRTGDTFDTLTLAPSIDTSKHGHWHGFIQNGEVTG